MNTGLKTHSEFERSDSDLSCIPIVLVGQKEIPECPLHKYYLKKELTYFKCN